MRYHSPDHRTIHPRKSFAKHTHTHMHITHFHRCSSLSSTCFLIPLQWSYDQPRLVFSTITLLT
jgi:hypothetical protein